MNRITAKDLEALRDIMALELGRTNGPTYTREGERNVALRGKLIIEEGSATWKLPKHLSGAKIIGGRLPALFTVTLGRWAR